MLLTTRVLTCPSSLTSPIRNAYKCAACRASHGETRYQHFWLGRPQEILDQWLKCQGKWQYLEPIFGAEEIMKQIPTEGAAFRSMDSTWRRIMEEVRRQPLMMDVADVPGLLEDLVACNQSLDVVEKGLNDFLDTKKMAFPRFFFLSNDEVLEVRVVCVACVDGAF